MERLISALLLLLLLALYAKAQDVSLNENYHNPTTGETSRSTEWYLLHLSQGEGQFECRLRYAGDSLLIFIRYKPSVSGLYYTIDRANPLVLYSATDTLRLYPSRGGLYSQGPVTIEQTYVVPRQLRPHLSTTLYRHLRLYSTDSYVECPLPARKGKWLRMATMTVLGL